MQQNEFPVIIVNKGVRPYLQPVLSQAKKFNSNVVLMGDDSNRKMRDCQWFNMEDFSTSEKWKEFEGVWKNLSTNPAWYELMCFKRFFVIEEYCRKNNFNYAAHLDSDILCYVNFNEYFSANPCRVSLSMPRVPVHGRETVSAHISFWTLEALSDFTDFCIDNYKNHFDRIKKYYDDYKSAYEGGICDMTLLGLWVIEHGTGFAVNNAAVANGAAFDHSINEPLNFDADGKYEFNDFYKIRKVEFIDGIPYFIKEGGEKIQALALHMQGDAKRLIAPFYKKWPDFFIRAYDVCYWFLRGVKRRIVALLKRKK